MRRYIWTYMLNVMGKLIMLKDDDHRRINLLRRRLKARSKAEVVRAGLELLEQQTLRAERSERLRRAAVLAAPSSNAFIREMFGPRRSRRG